MKVMQPPAEPTPVRLRAQGPARLALPLHRGPSQAPTAGLSHRHNLPPELVAAPAHTLPSSISETQGGTPICTLNQTDRQQQPHSEHESTFGSPNSASTGAQFDMTNQP